MTDQQTPIDRLYAIIERDGMAALAEPELGTFAIYWFVLETNNGGLHQFFFNDAGQLALPALRYLERIGATETASILRRAIALFPNGHVPIDQEERREVLAAIDDEAGLFNPLTSELFKCREDVNELHVAYARSHPEAFARIRPPP